MELDREDFRLWLAAKEPDDYAGESRLSLGCPLSTYLWERLGVRLAVTFLELRKYPSWCRSFVFQVDGAGEFGAVVTAKDALTILDSIEVSS